MKYLIIALAMCLGFTAAAQNAATPETVSTDANFDPAIIAQNYENWAAQELRQAIIAKADFKRTIVGLNIFSGERNAVAWDHMPTNKLAFAAGGISYTCDPDPNQTAGLFGTLGINEAQKQKLCDWRLWKSDFNPNGLLAQKLSADTIDMTAATAWLRRQRSGMPAITVSTPILWAGFADISASKLEWGATRETRWSAKSCPGITNLLTEIETLPAIEIDLPDFGNTGPKNKIVYNSEVSVSLSLFTQNSHTIKYPGLSETTHKLNQKIQTLMQNCAPDAT
jgi:hypothetical protein